MEKRVFDLGAFGPCLVHAYTIQDDFFEVEIIMPLLSRSSSDLSAFATGAAVLRMIGMPFLSVALTIGTPRSSVFLFSDPTPSETFACLETPSQFIMSPSSADDAAVLLYRLESQLCSF